MGNMSQNVNPSTQQKIGELLQKTKEKNKQAESGCTVIVEKVSAMTQGDKSSMRQKTDDKLGNMQVVQAEVHVAPKMEDETNPAEKESSDENASDEEGQLVVEFEDQSYELAQMYQLEDEYQDMTAEQKAAEVQTLMPWEQAEYQEMTKLHQ